MNLREYLLQCITEESAEVIQAAGKIQRFGPKDKYPKKYKGTTTDRLVHELNDLMGAVEEAVSAGILPRNWFRCALVHEKQRKIRKYMKYSRRKRRLRG